LICHGYRPLDDGGQRLLGHPARFQKTGKVAALAQFRDPQLDSPRPGLPVTLAIAIALDEARGGLLHQPLGGKGDHVAQNIRVGAFSTSARRCIMGSVIVVLPNGLSFATQAYPKFTVTTSAPSYTTLGDTILHASIPRLRIKSGSYSKACAARDMLNLYD
jgi:hypothetical protein